ncbi:DUF6641 family protein [Marinobacter sp. DSM 26671]|uniref:DUF6641 family protein n=1 Tax=Marinobacter sp. DSM 26671 TaxID=1761793 RepID=UPI0020C871DD|nr:DUF6641 family protein [Marinobacter sp. DSM 26671]
MYLDMEEAGMVFLKNFKFVELKGTNNKSPIFSRRLKLIAKIEEQLLLAGDSDYTPTKTKWVTDSDGNQKKVEVPKRVKRWWAKTADGKVNLVVRYGSKPLEFAKGKNAIQLDSEAEVKSTLDKLKEAVEAGELDAIIEQQAQSGSQFKKE